MSVWVLVMHVWSMSMRVNQRFMAMPMAMGACGHGYMRMGVVAIVVIVGVLVLHCFVSMFVHVVFSQVQPYTRQHQNPAGP